MKNGTVSAKEAIRKDFCRSSSQDCIGSAIELMQKTDARYLLVEEKGEICGVTTPHEVVGYPLSRLIMDCPIRPIITISEETHLDKVLTVLKTGEAAVLVVLDNKKEPLGILDQECVIAFLYQELERSAEEKEKYAAKSNKSEEALHTTKTFSENLIALMKDGFSMLSDQGVHIDVNPAFCRMTGFTKKELIGTGTPHIYWPPEEIEKIEKAFQQTFEGEFEDLELIFMRKNGERFPVIVSPSFIKDKNGKVVSCLATFKEITERKKAEEALKAERQRLFNVLEGMPIMVCLLTPDYHVAFANRAFRDKFGESHGRHCYEYCFGKKEPCDFCETYRVLETAKPHHWQVTTPDGASIIDVYDFPFTDADGSPMILEVDIDITEHKKAEDALRKSEFQLLNALKIARLGAWEYDVKNDMFTFNDAFYAIFRTTAKQVGGYTMSSADYSKRFLHPEDAFVVGEEIRKAIETKEPNFSRQLEHRIIYADGEVGYITVRFFVIKDEKGRTIKTYGVNQDLTERKKAENIVAQKMRLETILYGISARFVNASELITASSMDKAINSSLADMGKLSDADRSYIFLLREDGVTLDNTHEWCRKGVSSQINNRQNILSKMIPWWMKKLCKDKVILIENVSKMPRAAEKEKKIFQDQDVKSLLVLPLFRGGKIIGFMGFDSVQAAVKLTEDNLFLLRISAEIIEGALERVRAERRLLQEKTKSEKLAKKLKAAYENLETVQDGLLKRAKIATTGVIAAGVAHEIRNPLAIIGMTVQYLQSKLHEKDPKRELTEAIITKVERLDRVTKELSNYGRTMDLNLKKHNLKKCLDLNLALVKPKCRIQKIRIVKKYSRLPLVEMDDEQMDKAFLNIIDNAVQAMPRGGVLTVSTELGEDPDTAVIRIHNTGSAIKKRHIRYIFEPFYTLKARHMGTGLGLAICQGVVLRHSGEIYVENKSSGKNKGVTFIIHLPLSHKKQKRDKP